MTALTAKKANRIKRASSLNMLATAESVFQGGLAGIDLSTGLVRKVPAGGDPNMLLVGTFVENKTVTSGGRTLVRLFRELSAIWLANSAGGDAIAAANVGQLCYAVDDQTVALTSNGSTRSVAGRVWDVDATKGVLVEPLETGAAGAADGGEGFLALPLGAATEADATALAAFADGASNTPGYAVDNSEAFGIRWNNAAAPDPIAVGFMLPPDLDDSRDVVVEVLASKTGATLADATTFDVGLFTHPVGALRDADADAGGTTAAMTGDAASKTVQRVEVTIDAADLPATPVPATLTLQPTDGTIGTDDVTVHAVNLKYSRK